MQERKAITIELLSTKPIRVFMVLTSEKGTTPNPEQDAGPLKRVSPTMKEKRSCKGNAFFRQRELPRLY